MGWTYVTLESTFNVADQEIPVLLTSDGGAIRDLVDTLGVDPATARNSHQTVGRGSSQAEASRGKHDGKDKQRLHLFSCFDPSLFL